MQHPWNRKFHFNKYNFSSFILHLCSNNAMSPYTLLLLLHSLLIGSLPNTAFGQLISNVTMIILLLHFHVTVASVKYMQHLG